MMTRAPLPLVALLACALASSVPSPAAAAGVATTTAAGAGNRGKLRKVLRKKGLAKLPSASGALAARTRGKHRRGLAAAVTGTPPTLISIPDASVKDVFWRPGVVDAIAAGTASQEQCGEFFSGQADGQSGGMGACQMAQNVGYSLGDILSGDTSLCYMKRFPTRANLKAGALTLVSGSFPNDDPTRLFSVPAGSTSRVVRVAVSGQGEGKDETVFLRVHNDDENQTAGDLYAVDLWFCGGEATAKGFDQIHITSAGEFVSTEQQNDDGGAHVSTVRGFVTFNGGEVVFDTSRGRHAESSSTQGAQGSFKAEEEIGADDTIATKSYGTFENGSHQGYEVASFTGTSIDTLAFLAGAFKERNSGSGPPQPDFVGSTEYRSTFYASSPGSALGSRLTAVDFDTDPFYASAPSVTVDASAYSCTAPADVVLALDFANPAGAAVRAHCEQRLFDGSSQFCWDDPDLQAAQTNYPTACFFGPH